MAAQSEASDRLVEGSITAERGPSGKNTEQWGRAISAMRRGSRPTLVACIALLMSAIPAMAVRVDPIASQTRASTESTPPPVEGIEGKAAAPPPRLLAPAVVLDHALAVLGAHLLITGRPVQVEDSAVDPNPEVENQEPIATPLAYHPATLFEVAMGAVIVFVALSLVWLPRLRSERPRRHRRRPRAGSHRRYTNSRSTRDPAPGQKRTRVRRRSRRATAD